jgi:excisionase family DNA binding protein
LCHLIFESTFSVVSSRIPIMEETVGVGEAAKYLGVHRDTVLRWAKQGTLSHSITPMGRYRFLMSDLERAVVRVDKAAS